MSTARTMLLAANTATGTQRLSDSDDRQLDGRHADAESRLLCVASC